MKHLALIIESRSANRAASELAGERPGNSCAQESGTIPVDCNPEK